MLINLDNFSKDDLEEILQYVCLRLDLCDQCSYILDIGKITDSNFCKKYCRHYKIECFIEMIAEWLENEIKNRG